MASTLDNVDEGPSAQNAQAFLGALLIFSSLGSLAWAAENRLEGVDVTSDGVVVRTSAPASYSKTRLSDPDRVIFEFLGVKCAGCPREWKGQGKWLEGARAGQFRESPPVTRVVLDLTGAAPITEKAEGAALTVALGDKPAAPAGKAEPEPANPSPAKAKPPRRVAAASAPVAAVGGFLLDALESPLATASLAFAGITLCVALYRIRWMRSNLAAVHEHGQREARRVEAKLEDELQMIRRRLSSLEAKLSELQENGHGNGNALDAEAIRELRTVIKSLSESPLLPKS